MGTEERKHLGFLDGVALLLVTEDKGDVAAPSFSQTTSTIPVFYAKKYPCNGALNNYIDGILEDISKFRQSSQALLACKISLRATKQCIKRFVTGEKRF